ncbi:hypothetical protein VC81_04230 [Levilactobacillus spicheri]|uniref:Uncharacterized protein n=1 Tax=Levilactobacillus spicheri TaxID=216463 RepID=A0A0F3RT66_9LACO|nr:hypothetical protein VC81_04230 [Levilactobacillus spicheri]
MMHDIGITVNQNVVSTDVAEFRSLQAMLLGRMHERHIEWSWTLAEKGPHNRNQGNVSGHERRLRQFQSDGQRRFKQF